MARIRNKYPYTLRNVWNNDYVGKNFVVAENNKYSLGIGLTTRCNFDCPICYYHTKEKCSSIERDFPLELLKNILQNCKTLKNVNMALEGEPFCYPHLFEALDCAMETSESISISTNGSLLSKEKLLILKDYNFSMFSLSIEDTDEKLYAQHRKGGQLSHFIRNAGYAAEILKNRVIFNAVIYNKNLDSVQYLPKLASIVGVQTISLMPLRPHTETRKQGILPASDEEILKNIEIMCECADKYNIKLIFNSFYGIKKIKNWLIKNNIVSKTETEIKKCFLPWRYTSILSSGEIFPCCGDFKPENIKSYTFDGIFNHDYLIMLRGNILNNQNISACKECSFIDK